jgi:hypothetical protein
MNTARKTESAYDRTLKAWAKQWSDENVTPDVQKLINLATFDLYYGPAGLEADEPARDEYGNENEWAGYPGFTSACERIAEVVDDVPSTLWLDVDAEGWTDVEPEWEHPCERCEGSGSIPNSDPGTWPSLECLDCNGTGYMGEPTDYYYQVEREDLIAAVVGRELAKYL